MGAPVVSYPLVPALVQANPLAKIEKGKISALFSYLCFWRSNPTRSLTGRQITLITDFKKPKFEGSYQDLKDLVGAKLLMISSLVTRKFVSRQIAKFDPEANALSSKLAHYFETLLSSAEKATKKIGEPSPLDLKISAQNIIEAEKPIEIELRWLTNNELSPDEREQLKKDVLVSLKNAPDISAFKVRSVVNWILDPERSGSLLSRCNQEIDFPENKALTHQIFQETVKQLLELKKSQYKKRLNETSTRLETVVTELIQANTSRISTVLERHLEAVFTGMEGEFSNNLDSVMEELNHYLESSLTGPKVPNAGSAPTHDVTDKKAFLDGVEDRHQTKLAESLVAALFPLGVGVGLDSIFGALENHPEITEIKEEGLKIARCLIPEESLGLFTTFIAEPFQSLFANKTALIRDQLCKGVKIGIKTIVDLLTTPEKQQGFLADTILPALDEQLKVTLLEQIFTANISTMAPLFEKFCQGKDNLGDIRFKFFSIVQNSHTELEWSYDAEFKKMIAPKLEKVVTLLTQLHTDAEGEGHSLSQKQIIAAIHYYFSPSSGSSSVPTAVTLEAQSIYTDLVKNALAQIGLSGKWIEWFFGFHFVKKLIGGNIVKAIGEIRTTPLGILKASLSSIDKELTETNIHQLLDKKPLEVAPQQIPAVAQPHLFDLQIQRISQTAYGLIMFKTRQVTGFIGAFIARRIVTPNRLDTVIKRVYNNLLGRSVNLKTTLYKIFAIGVNTISGSNPNNGANPKKAFDAIEVGNSVSERPATAERSILAFRHGEEVMVPAAPGPVDIVKTYHKNLHDLPETVQALVHKKFEQALQQIIAPQLSALKEPLADLFASLKQIPALLIDAGKHSLMNIDKLKKSDKQKPLKTKRKKLLHLLTARNNPDKRTKLLLLIQSDERVKKALNALPLPLGKNIDFYAEPLLRWLFIETNQEKPLHAFCADKGIVLNEENKLIIDQIFDLYVSFLAEKRTELVLSDHQATITDVMKSKIEEAFKTKTEKLFDILLTRLSHLIERVRPNYKKIVDSLITDVHSIIVHGVNPAFIAASERPLEPDAFAKAFAKTGACTRAARNSEREGDILEEISRDKPEQLLRLLFPEDGVNGFDAIEFLTKELDMAGDVKDLLLYVTEELSPYLNKEMQAAIAVNQPILLDHLNRMSANYVRHLLVDGGTKLFATAYAQINTANLSRMLSENALPGIKKELQGLIVPERFQLRLKDPTFMRRLVEFLDAYRKENATDEEREAVVSSACRTFWSEDFSQLISTVTETQFTAIMTPLMSDLFERGKSKLVGDYDPEIGENHLPPHVIEQYFVSTKLEPKTDNHPKIGELIHTLLTMGQPLSVDKESRGLTLKMNALLSFLWTRMTTASSYTGVPFIQSRLSKVVSEELAPFRESPDELLKLAFGAAKGALKESGKKQSEAYQNLQEGIQNVSYLIYELVRVKLGPYPGAFTAAQVALSADSRYINQVIEKLVSELLVAHEEVPKTLFLELSTNVLDRVGKITHND